MYARNLQTQQAPSAALPQYHIVQSGDTLWKIAQRYQNGLTVGKLAQLNSIATTAVLHQGQQLRLR
jgi:LysM repeat protein